MPCWVVSSGSTVILRCRYLMYVRLRCELAFDRRCRCGRRSYAGSFSLIGLRTGAKAFLTIERGLETTFRSGEKVMHTRVWSCFGLVFGIGDEIDVVLNSLVCNRCCWKYSYIRIRFDLFAFLLVIYVLHPRLLRLVTVVFRVNIVIVHISMRCHVGVLEFPEAQQQSSINDVGKSRSLQERQRGTLGSAQISCMRETASYQDKCHKHEITWLRHEPLNQMDQCSKILNSHHNLGIDKEARVCTHPLAVL